MKKMIFALIIILIIPIFAVAEVIPRKVLAVTPFDLSYKTIHNGSVLELIAIENSNISEGITINAGEKFSVKIVKYVKPKRGKRDGYYKIEYLHNDNNVVGSMRVSTPKDLEGTVKSVGVSVVGHVLKVPGFSQAVAISKGLIKPDGDKSRLASAGENLYQSTPLKYVEKGKDFVIEKDGVVVLKLRVNNLEE